MGQGERFRQDLFDENEEKTRRTLTVVVRLFQDGAKNLPSSRGGVCAMVNQLRSGQEWR